MSGLYLRGFACACACLMLSLEANAQANDTSSDFCASRPERLAIDPLVSLSARNNFLDYVDRLALQSGHEIRVPEDFMTVSREVSVWGYRLEPGSATHCKLYFVQRYRLADFLNEIQRAVSAFRREGCSFFSTRNVSIRTSGARGIVATGSVSGTQRHCGKWPWGGEWNYDVGSIGGSVTVRTGFDTAIGTTGGRFQGEIVPQDFDIQPNVQVESIFGIDTDSVVGQFLGAVVGDPVSTFFVGPVATAVLSDGMNKINESVRGVQRAFGDANFLDWTEGIFSIEDYLKFQQDIKSAVWSYQPLFYISDSLTRFYGPSDNPSLDVVFEASVPKFVARAVWADVSTEIDLLESFSEDERVRTLMAGETLWSIAEEEYGSAFYYPMLAHANGWDYDSLTRLEEGQVVRLPPMHELSPREGVHFLSPGETIFELCSEWMPQQQLECYALLKGKNPGIELSKVYALQPIIKP